MRITFEHITLKNFMSYGDTPTTFYLNRSYSTLISGTNGSGKSSFIEAFVFAIAGKTYRGSNKPDLINTTNQKDCVVELVFTKNNSTYKVIRGMKPNIFKIEKDGKFLEESASIKDMQQHFEQHILQSPITGIVKTCILGCDYKPFMVMTSKEKRDLIETLLEISVFSDMNKLLKTKISTFKDEYTEYTNNLKIKEKLLEAKKELYDSLISSEQKAKAKDKKELQILKQRLDGITNDISKKKEELSLITTSIDIVKNKSEIENTSATISIQNHKIRETKELIEKFKNMSGECHECGQDVSDKHKELHINTHQNALTQLTVELQDNTQMLKELKTTKAEYEKYQTKRQKILDEIKVLDATLNAVKETTTKKIKEYKTTINVDDIVIENTRNDYQTLNVEYNDLKGRECEFNTLKQTYLLAGLLLKDDGIKASILSQYIPLLNQCVNYYLKKLNSPLTFNIDKNLDVRLDSRYPNEFSYHSLSMGERQRIDLSISFAWRKVAAIKNSVNTNILVLDETFDSSIDGDGVDDLLAILEDMQNANINVFVISHKNLLDDKLRSVVRVEKKNGFSRIAA
jgi:DNA repair exonuclease SbcCD ATPase subunit